MSGTLSFSQRLLDRGRNLERLGQTQAASDFFSRLVSFRELPPDVAEEAHCRLAEAHLQCRQFKKARRSLAAALALRPANAHYHYLMAGALEDDENCEPSEALARYRHCIALDSTNPVYWCDFGILLLREGEADEGLDALRRAHDLAPNDPDFLGHVAEGLRYEGQYAEAESLLRAALFRNARDRRFRDLWMQHKFALLHADQWKAKRPSPRPAKHDRVILPFSRPVPNEGAPAKKRIRRDLPSGTPHPKLPSRRRLSDKQCS